MRVMFDSKPSLLKGKHNTSRYEIIDWINSILLLNITSIEQLGTGAIYCQLLDALYPERVPLHKVNWKARFQYEIISNYKILQAAFDHLGIEKQLDVQRLSKCKNSSNWQVIQWFKQFIDSQGGVDQSYNPLARRKNTQINLQLNSDNFNNRRYQSKNNNKQNNSRNNSCLSKSYLPSTLNLKYSTERSFINLSQNRQKPQKMYSLSNYNTVRTMFSIEDVPFIDESDQIL